MSISSLSLTSSGDDSDEEVRRAPRIIKDRNDLFESLDEHDFRARFRLSKGTVMELLHLFGNDIEPATLRNKSICSRDQLLITLRFYSTGTFQQVIIIETCIIVTLH